MTLRSSRRLPVTRSRELFEVALLVADEPGQFCSSIAQSRATSDGSSDITMRPSPAKDTGVSRAFTWSFGSSSSRSRRIQSTASKYISVCLLS